jgi:hypothetical protein
MSGRTNQNFGVVEQLLGGVRYAVEAKDGSLIPCVEYTKFQVIHAELPGILLRLRTKQVANLTSKFQDGWRYAHGNDQDHLPEFTVMALNGQGQKVAKRHDNVRLADGATMEEQKFQQFQEYDVSMMLKQELNVTKVKGSKEMSDLGATRVVVDECFEHVYFSLEHYREIESQQYGSLNPWVFVLFAQPGIQEMVRIDKLKDFKEAYEKSIDVQSSELAKTGAVPASLLGAKVTQKTKEGLQQAIFSTVFAQNNFVEDKQSSIVRKGTFNSKSVTILVPSEQRRQRRGSLVISGNTLAQILQPPPPPPQQQVAPVQLPVQATLQVPVQNKQSSN